MKYLGDFPTGATIYIPFATYDKDDGSSITLTGLAVTDIEIYKNGSVTQRASDAGYTLLDTDGIDFDGITGIHGFSVDTSDNTDAGFYTAGGEYWVVVSAVTVDAVAISFIAATFSIERSGGALALLKHADYGLAQLVRSTTPANKLDISAGGEAGVDWANVGSPTTAVNLSGTNIKTDQKVDVETIKTQAVTCAAGVTVLASVGTAATSTAQTGDSYAIVSHATYGNSALNTKIGTAQTDLDTITGADGVTLATSQGNYAPLRGGVAMTEAYAADGATATPEQMLYMIWSALSEFAISGTTITCKKLDGTTTALTFTLDSSTAPTSRTRAT